MVALRRSLSGAPCPRRTRRLASGARRYGVHGSRSPRPGSFADSRLAGSRRDRRPGANGDRLAEGRLAGGCRPRRPSRHVGRATRGSEPDGGAGQPRSGEPRGVRSDRGRGRCGAGRAGAARVLASACRRPAPGRALRRCSAPCRVGWPRNGCVNRRTGSRCQTINGECARNGARHRRCRRRAGEGSVAHHPGGAGTGTGANRSVGWRRALGLRPGVGARSTPATASDGRSRPRFGVPSGPHR